jgi:CheY-specific phosphatase CheX
MTTKSRSSTFDLLPFVEALNRIFVDMADIRLANGPIESTITNNITADVHSRVGLYADVSSSVGIFAIDKASLLITIQESGALKLTRILTGQELQLHDRLVTDTIGEVLNIVVGAAQRASPIKFEFSVPVSIQGKGHEILMPRDSAVRYCISRFDGESVCLILSQGL